MMDRFSRWLVAVSVKDIKAQTIAKAFYVNWVCHYGIPDYVISDQGAQFESAIFKEMCTALDIKKRRTTPYHPESNGILERAHATLKQTLRCFAHKFADWEQALPTAIFAMRTAINDQGISPSLVVFGEHIAIPGIYVTPETTFDEKSESEFVQQLTTYWFQVRDFILKHDNTLSGPQ